MIGADGLGKRPQAGRRKVGAGLFNQRKNDTIIQAAGTTLGLIYHQTVYNLRNDHRNAIMGLVLTILQSLIFVAAFMLFFLFFKVRTSPIRGTSSCTCCRVSSCSWSMSRPRARWRAATRSRAG